MIPMLFSAIINTVWAVLMAYQTMFWRRAFKDLEKHGVPAPHVSFVFGWVLTGVFGAIALSCWTVLLMGVAK